MNFCIFKMHEIPLIASFENLVWYNWKLLPLEMHWYDSATKIYKILGLHGHRWITRWPWRSIHKHQWLFHYIFMTRISKIHDNVFHHTRTIMRWNKIRKLARLTTGRERWLESCYSFPNLALLACPTLMLTL